jgi:membrane protease YdiL (CAAX protease family)
MDLASDGARQRVRAADPPANLTAGLSVMLLLLAVAVEPLRLPTLLILAVGFVLALRRTGPGALAARSSTLVQAACLLVALGAVWSGVVLPAGARDGSSCADVLAPFAAYRAVGAGLVLLAVAVVVRLLASRAPAIGLRRPTRRELALPAGALAVVGLVATVIGPALAEPFFGPLPVSLGSVSALAPALLFAIANASMEETMYRGVLLRWVMPAAGAAGALALQAAAFGLAHGVGSDFAASPLPVMAATAAGGLALGIIALRSGSLLLPIALHAALDIPIYYANACLRP